MSISHNCVVIPAFPSSSLFYFYPETSVLPHQDLNLYIYIHIHVYIYYCCIIGDVIDIKDVMFLLSILFIFVQTKAIFSFPSVCM